MPNGVVSGAPFSVQGQSRHALLQKARRETTNYLFIYFETFVFSRKNSCACRGVADRQPIVLLSRRFGARCGFWAASALSLEKQNGGVEIDTLGLQIDNPCTALGVDASEQESTISQIQRRPWAPLSLLIA